MCGIVGVIQKQNQNNHPADIVLEGLKRLEYRGYDSAGIACTSDTVGMQVTKAAGKIANLEAKLNTTPFAEDSSIAIGHTRWATHGQPTEANAHPHSTENVALVHNGIIENFEDLRRKLQAQGVEFKSETDTETVVQNIQHHSSTGKAAFEAVQQAVVEAQGAFALGITFKQDPHTLYASRRSAPLVVGIGENANFIGSDPMALANNTNKFIFLEDNDIAVITADKIAIYDINGNSVNREIKEIDITKALAGKNGFEHFMMKEIHEQPAVVARLLENYLDGDKVSLPHMPFDLNELPQISLVACGTAFYACELGKYLIEQASGKPVSIDVASEFRYRNPPLLQGGLFVAVSQSGETADTLAAMEYAKARGQFTMAITNTPTSSIARMADVVIDLKCGPEVAVASTKAFMAMATAFALITTSMLSAENLAREYVQALKELPAKLTQTIDNSKPLQKLANALRDSTDMLYLGRGALSPISHEGALKIKEISYIHAESYASGEMKHGPIALIDESWPVVNLASTSDGLFEKTISNMKEVEARKGNIILITDEAGAKASGKIANHIITVPSSHALTAPMVFTIPLQLLAYYTALVKGNDVDQPRNLAKSVTVE